MDSADTVDPIHYDGIYDHASVDFCDTFFFRLKNFILHLFIGVTPFEH